MGYGVASLMESLIDVLEKESDEYKNLLNLSMQKTQVIVSEDLDQLARITDEEQLIVSRINHLDTIRNEAVQDIANVLNKDVTKLKIADLIKMLGQRPEEQQKLAAAFDVSGIDSECAGNGTVSYESYPVHESGPRNG